MPERNPGRSLRGTMATDPRDWSLCKRDAWIYGIVVGWVDCWEEIARKHDWSASDLARLIELHVAFTYTFDL